jgi:hypothetical protein
MYLVTNPAAELVIQCWCWPTQLRVPHTLCLLGSQMPRGASVSFNSLAQRGKRRPYTLQLM